jgi:hypothetical protein
MAKVMDTVMIQYNRFKGPDKFSEMWRRLERLAIRFCLHGLLLELLLEQAHCGTYQ